MVALFPCHCRMTTAAPVTMSDELEGKLISLAADILIDNLVQGEEKGHIIKASSSGVARQKTQRKHQKQVNKRIKGT